MKNLIYIFLCFLLVASNALGTDYYCDPASGRMSNLGTSGSPWSTLDSVFITNKTFAAGDTIFLLSGYHGLPIVKGNNSGYVTIKPQGNAVVNVKGLSVTSASRWVISGLNISRELIGVYSAGSTLVGINSTASYITVQNCFIYSALDITGWSQTDLETKTGTGVSSSGKNCLITKNHLKNLGGGIEGRAVSISGDSTVFSFNTVENIVADGLQVFANYVRFEYNVVKNFYVANSNHDDIFQCWTFGAPIYGIVLRGNTFIAQTDPNQPFPCAPQGIGCFDGYYDGWIIENNLVVVNHWHGITLLGARNCKVVNNTVIDSPIKIACSACVPWITIGNHKDGTYGTGNIARNNLVSTVSAMVGTTVSNNIETTEYTSHFIDYSGFDFHLKSGSSAINAGTTTDAPIIDLDRNARVSPYDVGCYAFDSGSDVQVPTIPTEPITFELSQNYPNPFNPTTSIKYQVPKSSFVKISVYNILGIEVRTLVNAEQSAGSYAVKLDANGLSSGVYFYKIQAGEFMQSKKMLLTK